MTTDDLDGYDTIDAVMLCGGCAFWKKSNCRNESAACTREQREDGRLVVFKKRQPDVDKSDEYAVQNVFVG